jgi:hypothetical protein
MTTFKPIAERTHFDGTQKLYRFPNGFGASVVRNSLSYGGQAGLWELAVVCFEGDTEITSDVLGYLSEAKVEKILRKIEQIK